MSDPTALELALCTVAGARVQAVRLAPDGSASVVVDAEGLDDTARTALEAGLKDAATGAGVATLRVAMSASRRRRRRWAETSQREVPSSLPSFRLFGHDPIDLVESGEPLDGLVERGNAERLHALLRSGRANALQRRPAHQ